MNELDRESFEKWLQESNAKAELLLKHGVSSEKVTEMMKLYALDGIQRSLDKLASCTGAISGEDNRLLYISGGVTTYEPY